MRALALVVLAAAAAGCVSGAAARRVRILGAKPPAACRVVDERLHGDGGDASAAFFDLRRNAVRRGASDLVVTDGPRAAGAGMTVDAIGYACPETMQ